VASFPPLGLNVSVDLRSQGEIEKPAPSIASAIVLKDVPQWTEAARGLVHGLAGFVNNEEAQIQVLLKLCKHLGDSLYPGFLKVLCVVEHQGDLAAHKLIAQSLASAISTGRLPTGQLSAWGSSNWPAPFGLDPSLSRQFLQTNPGNQPQSPLLSAGLYPLAKSANRSLGPIEFLCAWYSQPTALETLTTQEFEIVLEKLIRLISSSASAQSLYIQKLKGDLSTPMEGAMSRQTRQMIEHLTQKWESSLDPAQWIKLISAQGGGLMRPDHPNLSSG
jgi:hypothetical protein